MSSSPARQAVETVWRMESPRLIAALARLVRDVGLAEDLAHDALEAALKSWPRDGVPDKPGAWLMTTARNRALDRMRKQKRSDQRADALRQHLQTTLRPEKDPDDHVGDDLLRLMFMACHPILTTEARVALTLRLLGGLTTQEIARAFLTQEATVAQRLVRAKRTLAKARVPFELPPPHELKERLGSVLEVIYLIFNEGYSATRGEDWMRPELCRDALRLGRVLAGLAPQEPEVHGLVALMELQASRTRARLGPSGEPVRLLEQNRGRWDQLLIHRGLASLRLAETLGGAHGFYALQAAIAACHAQARTPQETHWARIAALYSVMATLQASPVVELNRAVAVGMALGPAAGLQLVEPLTREPSLESYHHLYSVRGDFLEKLGRGDEAAREFERAASLTQNAAEQLMLRTRAAQCRPRTVPGAPPGRPDPPPFPLPKV